MINKFETRRVYTFIKEEFTKVEWRHLLYTNLARHRALFVFWLACRKRLATKERLKRFGI